MTGELRGETPAFAETERQRRWRLILGAAAEGALGGLGGTDAGVDRALGALYDGAGAGGTGDDEPDADRPRRGGLEGSAPQVARWLGDIREYFPSSVVQVLQRDALERLHLRQMLLEPELLGAVEPDVGLVADLVALSAVMPDRTKATARLVVRRVVDELERRLANRLRQAVHGSLNRAARNRRPKHHEIDWHRTIRANLRHYQPAYRTVIPERRIGFGRRQSALRDVLVCVDQSGSMAASVVYAGVFAAVLAGIRTLRTRMVAFDTSVADLSHLLADPVDILFGVQLGGGTDINRAIAYAETLVERPAETILVLISDLYEGGDRAELHERLTRLVGSGVRLVALLALSDRGAPAYDHAVAAHLADLDVPAFACTPDHFPDLMAAAIHGRHLADWAAANGITTAR